MDAALRFLFREKFYTCEVCIDTADDPQFIFMILNDKGFIQEFGDEITIKTDFQSRLSKRDDFAELTKLRQAIFEALKYHPAYIAQRTKLKL